MTKQEQTWSVHTKLLLYIPPVFRCNNITLLVLSHNSQQQQPASTATPLSNNLVRLEYCVVYRIYLRLLNKLVSDMTSVSRRLCRCHEGRGPPISAVGSPTPPPYPASPSEEFQTPPLEFMPVADLPSPPPSPTALPVPPPVSQSPIPFLEQVNTPPACCANPPTTEGPLVPIEVESDDADGSGEVAEGTMD